MKKEIFVFGSNEAGIHGGGAAKVARLRHGAILGRGFGLQGDSFAIPTCARPMGEPNCEIPLKKVAEYVKQFIRFAREHEHDVFVQLNPTEPEMIFKITQIGCGLAGFKHEENCSSI